MKNVFLCVMMAMMTACAADAPNAATSTTDQKLICDPNCDPGNFQYLVSQVIGEAAWLGQQLFMECSHYNGGYDPISEIWHPAHDECSAVYQDPWGQNYNVNCSSLPQNGCHHYACGWDNSQLPCYSP